MADVRYIAGLVIMFAGLMLACILVPLAWVCDQLYAIGDRLSE